MALNTMKCNHLTRLGLKGLKTTKLVDSVMQRSHHTCLSLYQWWFWAYHRQSIEEWR